MAKAGQVVIAVAAGAVIGWLLFLWAGGNQPTASLLGTSFSYQPPTPPADPLGFVAKEAQARHVYLGEADGFNQRLGYLDRTEVATYSGEWAATHDGQAVWLLVELESRSGNWRVKTWQENYVADLR